MISVEMEDVLAVLQLCKPYIIGIVADVYKRQHILWLITKRVWNTSAEEFCQ